MSHKQLFHIYLMCKFEYIYLLSGKFDWIWPPIVDDSRESNHEDEGVKSENPDRISLFDNPGG